MNLFFKFKNILCVFLVEIACEDCFSSRRLQRDVKKELC